MSQRIIIAALLVVFIASTADAQNRFYRRRGAILGGLAGAAIGVAIGDKGGNETTGALVGGAVGAIAGGAIGNQKDQRIEHNQRYHSGYQSSDPLASQHDYPGQPIYSQTQPGYPVYRQPAYPQPITPADVIQMQHRGLSESTIIHLIQTHGVAVKPTVSQVIDMHEHGVSERVIVAMQGDGVVETDFYVPSPTYDVSSPPFDGAETTYGPSIIGPSNGR